jgi:hypothetical protein
MLAFSPDGLLLAHGRGREIVVWDVGSGKELGRLKGHQGAVCAGAFAPNGKTLATGSADTTVLVWDVAALTRGARQGRELPRKGAAGAADLSKVDRTITKEPAYRSKPKYCLLVFGPQARHRLWLVIDGDVLYVDRKGNADLTAAGSPIKAGAWTTSQSPAIARERSFEVGDVTVGGLTHARLLVSQAEHRRKAKVSANADPGDLPPEQWQQYLSSVWRQVPDGLTCTVSISLDPRCYGRFGGARAVRPVRHLASIDHTGLLAFAARPANAPVIHFGGPLTLDLRFGARLQRGNKPGEVRVSLGTRGLGPGTFAVMWHDLVPEDIGPVVEVCFPKGESGQAAVTRKYALERC